MFPPFLKKCVGKHRPAVKNTQSDRAQDKTSETERLRQTREWRGVAGKGACESESEVNRMREEIMEDREKMEAKFTASVGEVGRLAPAPPPRRCSGMWLPHVY